MVVILAYQQNFVYMDTIRYVPSNLCQGKLAVTECNDASQTSQ